MTIVLCLLLAILIPLLGAGVCLTIRDPARIRIVATCASTAAFVAGLSAGMLFHWRSDVVVPPGTSGWPGAWISIDRLSAPLLPLASLLWLMTGALTSNAGLSRFSFPRTLVLQSLTLATLANREPWGVIGCLIVGIMPPWLELRQRGRSTRMYLLHMTLFALLLILGQLLEDFEGPDRFTQWWAAVPLLIAVLIRCGVVPFHLWVGQLLDQGSFGLGLLVMTPMLGAYACVRLVLPVAPDWVLRWLAVLSVVTALHCSGLAVVQKEGRRLFACLFLSQSALVLVGLEMVTDLGLTGALCLWLSVGLSLGGVGLTLRTLEARRGRVDLARLGGLYHQAPAMAVTFVLVGLACVGFPGTVNFVGAELLVDGVVEAYPFSGAAIVIATALNGIAIIRAFFLIFAGRFDGATVQQAIRPRERPMLLGLTMLVLLGGLIPQPWVSSRYEAARELLSHREPTLIEEAPHSLEPLDDGHSPAKSPPER